MFECVLDKSVNLRFQINFNIGFSGIMRGLKYSSNIFFFDRLSNYLFATSNITKKKVKVFLKALKNGMDRYQM